MITVRLIHCTNVQNNTYLEINDDQRVTRRGKYNWKSILFNNKSSFTFSLNSYLENKRQEK